MSAIFTRIIRICAAAFVLALLGGGAPAAAQDADKPRSWPGTVAVKSLNVRGGPGEGYPIVAKLSEGDKVDVFAAAGKWVQLKDVGEADKEAWVYRAFLRLPKDFMAPAFGDAENAFLDWAATRGDLAQISVEGRDRLSIILQPVDSAAPADADAAKERAQAIAEEIACAYRKRLSVTEVTVTVWTEKGPVAGWLAQAGCP